MKKITFQRKQSVIKRVFLLLIIAFISDLSAQTTILTVGAGRALNINSEGTLNVSGLELKPSTNYTINETQISKELTAVSLSNTQSMKKVYTLDTDIENFLGTISYNYVDSDMNNLTHDASMYVYDSTSSEWSEYLDTSNRHTTFDEVGFFINRFIVISILRIADPNGFSFKASRI